jgi:hypothetical protein
VTGRGHRDTPEWAKTISELRSLSDAELIAQHDELITGKFQTGDAVRTDYYRDELSRRAVERQGQRMTRLTAVIAVLTVVNVVAVTIALFVE